MVEGAVNAKICANQDTNFFHNDFFPYGKVKIKEIERTAQCHHSDAKKKQKYSHLQRSILIECIVYPGGLCLLLSRYIRTVYHQPSIYS